MNKVRVVWLCHFTNDEIQKIINPRRKVKEIAPWITNHIKLIEGRNDIELHVVSPHRWLPRQKDFRHKNIFYHFFNPGIPFTGISWPGFFRLDRLTGYYRNKRNICRKIRKIDPDIIHLFGAENAYYSSGILQFKNEYPVLVTIQGFINHSSSESINVKYRQEVEKKILSSFRHFGYRTETMGKTIKSYNQDANLHWHSFPIFVNEDHQTPFSERKYDVVFFARLSKHKGIEDLLKAINLLKENHKDISAIIIGSASDSYLAYLKKLSKDLSISKNITWLGFLPTQEEVHKIASQAKISVLPTYFEIIAGTIIESLFLKIPVVAYDVGSIHELNKERESVALVKKEDIDSLASEMENLLNNKGLWDKYAEQGYRTISARYNNEEVVPRLLEIYNTVINDF